MSTPRPRLNQTFIPTLLDNPRRLGGNSTAETPTTPHSKSEITSDLRPTKSPQQSPIRFFNTLTRKKDTFTPISAPDVSMYTCGPTVYHFAHIGNLRTYIFEDILKRTLQHAGYNVNHVMNYTDVGHLQSDGDDGQDKMLIAAEREQKDPAAIARFYENAFQADCQRLRIMPPNVACRASEHITDIQKFIKQLEKKGVTYTVDGNVYFNVNAFPAYADFARQKPGKKASTEPTGSRVALDPRKQQQADFVLWFSQSKYPRQIMKWDSCWGTGFPGWHIECSAMAMKYLGQHIDIHCGGLDHIDVHHTNEIAQSESLTGQQWVNYWLHGSFLTLDSSLSGKMSKSSGQFLTLDNLESINIQPEHFRYYCLSGHYRSELVFSFERLKKAIAKYDLIKSHVCRLANAADEKAESPENNTDTIERYSHDFWEALHDDLNTIGALEVLFATLKDKVLSNKNKLDLLMEFDTVLNLGIAEMRQFKASETALDVLNQREAAKKRGDFPLSDTLRTRIANEHGIAIEDTPTGPLLVPRKPIDWAKAPTLLNKTPVRHDTHELKENSHTVVKTI